MTLAPSTLLGIRFDYVRDESLFVQFVPPRICAFPGCHQPPDPGFHHIEPRSRTGGPRMFVIIDSLVVPNICRLCWHHHRLLTGSLGGHEARIVWAEPGWAWEWLRGPEKGTRRLLDGFSWT